MTDISLLFLLAILVTGIALLSLLFECLKNSCEHVWRFAGKGLRAALVPEWIFKCKNCKQEKWRAEGCFPDEESFVFYKDEMGDDFKPEWAYVVSESLNQITISRNLQRIKDGTYFDEGK